jgi:hypothetical protein
LREATRNIEGRQKQVPVWGNIGNSSQNRQNPRDPLWKFYLGEIRGTKRSMLGLSMLRFVKIGVVRDLRKYPDPHYGSSAPLRQVISKQTFFHVFIYKTL